MRDCNNNPLMAVALAIVLTGLMILFPFVAVITAAAAWLHHHRKGRPTVLFRIIYGILAVICLSPFIIAGLLILLVDVEGCTALLPFPFGSVDLCIFGGVLFASAFVSAVFATIAIFVWHITSALCRRVAA